MPLTLTLSGLVSANGADQQDVGIGGGGGRIAFFTASGSIENLGGTISVLGGGTSTFISGPPGGNGVVTVTPTPEPGIGVITLLGMVMLCIRRSGRR